LGGILAPGQGSNQHTHTRKNLPRPQPQNPFAFNLGLDFFCSINFGEPPQDRGVVLCWQVGRLH